MAIPDNVHSARWINQIADQGWDLHVFPSFEAPLHPDFRNVTTYSVADSQHNPRRKSKVLWPLPKGGDRLRLISTKFPPHWFSRAAWLSRLIRWLKPDIIHTLEFQRAGYLTLEAKSLFKGRFPTWIATNWGSDISLFGPLSGHTEKIKGILANCDYYSSECHRDVELARAYGFKGETLPVMPGAGGFDVEGMQQYRQPGPTSARRLITLKGYQTWAGRAMAGLRAIELSADLLKEKGYRVALYLAGTDVRLAAERIAVSTGIAFEDIPASSHETRDEVLRLHGRARVSIGLSISDGLSASALEAIVMGAFPIQSNTSCLTEEFVRDGETILMVHPEDPTAIAAAIRRAVTDDNLVDRAAEINRTMAMERLSSAVIQPQVIAMYKKLAKSLGLTV